MLLHSMVLGKLCLCKLMRRLHNPRGDFFELLISALLGPPKCLRLLQWCSIQQLHCNQDHFVTHKVCNIHLCSFLVKVQTTGVDILWMRTEIFAARHDPQTLTSVVILIFMRMSPPLRVMMTKNMPLKLSDKCSMQSSIVDYNFGNIVDSLYLEHPLSRTSLYLELKSQSL